MLHHEQTIHESKDKKPGAWVTLVTKTSYLPGCLILNHSLRSVKSKYPLLVMLCGLPEAGKEILSLMKIEYWEVEKLAVKDSKENSHEARFLDCWTKLRYVS